MRSCSKLHGNVPKRERFVALLRDDGDELEAVRIAHSLPADADLVEHSSAKTTFGILRSAITVIAHGDTEHPVRRILRDDHTHCSRAPMTNGIADGLANDLHRTGTEAGVLVNRDLARL